MKRLIPTVLLLSLSAWASQQYPVKGMILKVDPAHKSFSASCQSIPGFMAAMTMPFDVHDSTELDRLVPGAMVDFTLVVDSDSSYATHVHVSAYQSAEQDPLTARRLKVLKSLSSPAAVTESLAVGRSVPDFTLIDQT